MEFRPMRRTKQQLPLEESREILYKGSHGVLALSGDGGWPYALPISYVYDGEKLYFHCGRQGHKLDAIAKDPRCSFCVVGQDLVAPERYSTDYRSVIVFGTLRILDSGSPDFRRAIEALALKYCPGEKEEDRAREIERYLSSLCMLELTIEHLSGKEGLYLAQERGK